MKSIYNINQLSLAMDTDYQPEKNHSVYCIHQLIESLTVSKPNLMGRPREYDPQMLLRLVLLAYIYGIVSCRKIARFIVSQDSTEMIETSFRESHDYLQNVGLIDEASFIDGTKILANANKYSFV